MGAHSFTDFGEGADVKKAYDSVYSQREWESGNEYSGTITTTHGYRVLRREPMLRVDADRLIERYFDAEEEGERINGWAPEKWGSAGAIPVADPKAFKTREVKVLVPEARGGYLSPENLAKLAKLHIGSRLRDGETIASVSVLADDVKRKVEQRGTEGKAVTRYIVLQGSRVVGKGFESMKDAREAARKLASGEAGVWATDAEFDIVGTVRREDGGPLVKTRAVVAKRKLTLKVTVARKVREPKTIGWLFFGMAAS